MPGVEGAWGEEVLCLAVPVASDVWGPRSPVTRALPGCLSLARQPLEHSDCCPASSGLSLEAAEQLMLHGGRGER